MFPFKLSIQHITGLPFFLFLSNLALCGIQSTCILSIYVQPRDQPKFRSDIRLSRTNTMFPALFGQCSPRQILYTQIRRTSKQTYTYMCIHLQLYIYTHTFSQTYLLKYMHTLILQPCAGRAAADNLWAPPPPTLLIGVPPPPIICQFVSAPPIPLLLRSYFWNFR